MISPSFGVGTAKSDLILELAVQWSACFSELIYANVVVTCHFFRMKKVRTVCRSQGFADGKRTGILATLYHGNLFWWHRCGRIETRNYLFDPPGKSAQEYLAQAKLVYIVIQFGLNCLNHLHQKKQTIKKSSSFTGRH